MTGPAEWPPALVALVERMTGKPLEALAWQELVPVRDRVCALLNAEVNRRQAPPGGDAA